MAKKPPAEGKELTLEEKYKALQQECKELEDWKNAFLKGSKYVGNPTCRGYLDEMTERYARNQQNLEDFIHESFAMGSGAGIPAPKKRFYEGFNHVLWASNRLGQAIADMEVAQDHLVDSLDKEDRMIILHSMRLLKEQLTKYIKKNNRDEQLPKANNPFAEKTNG